jgi:hypothetical protein
MLLRHARPRSRGRWICFGLGLTCAGGLAISGCSRTPVLKSGGSPIADAGTNGSDSRLVDRIWGDRPGGTEGVARSAPPAGQSEESWTRFGAIGDRGTQISEGFANWRKSIQGGESEPSGDPFLDRERPAASEATRESLAAAQSGSRFSSTSELSGRSVTGRDGVASTQSRPSGWGTIPEGVARIHAEEDRTGTAYTAGTTSHRESFIDTASLTERSTGSFERIPGTSASTASSASTSRLEALQADLDRSASTTGRESSTGANDRGVLLSDAGRTTGGGSRMSTMSSRNGTSSIDRVLGVTRTPEASTTATTASTTNGTGAGTTQQAGSSSISPDEARLRIQSLLVSADWQLERGELAEAYRSAVLAQKMADTTGVTFDAEDRRPTEVASRVWKAMRERDGEGTQLAGDPGKSGTRTSQPVLAAHTATQPELEAAFAGLGTQGWQTIITPAGGARQLPSASETQSAPTPSIAEAETTPDPTIRLTADLDNRTDKPADGPQLAAGKPNAGAGRRPPQQFVRRNPLQLAAADVDETEAGGGVVQAEALTTTKPPARRRPGANRPTAAVTPGMTSLPTNRAVGGPMLGRTPAPKPTASATQPAAGPSSADLEQVVTERLARPALETESTEPVDRGVLWGAAGLAVGALGVLLAFRRRRPQVVSGQAPATR